MSPRKSRTAAIQATKALTTIKKQPARAKKKPDPRKKKAEKSSNTLTTKDQVEPTKATAIAESNNDSQTSSGNIPEIKSESKSQKSGRNSRRKVISQERLLTVINQIGSTVGECSEKRLRTETEEIPLTQAVQEEAEEEEEEEGSEQRTIYSCKFCNKDFSSAFVLFLHIRIHEKVGNVNEPTDQAESVPPSVEEQQFIDDDSDDEPQIKEEIIEEITIPDADDDEPEENDPLQINEEPRANFVGIINKNFVENLRKNLSLALNRQIN